MSASTDIVICEPLRTAIGKYGGSLRPLGAAELGSQLLSALVERSGLDVEQIDDVVLGHSYPRARHQLSDGWWRSMPDFP